MVLVHHRVEILLELCRIHNCGSTTSLSWTAEKFQNSRPCLVPPLVKQCFVFETQRLKTDTDSAIVFGWYDV